MLSLAGDCSSTLWVFWPVAATGQGVRRVGTHPGPALDAPGYAADRDSGQGWKPLTLAASTSLLLTWNSSWPVSGVTLSSGSGEQPELLSSLLSSLLRSGSGEQPGLLSSVLSSLLSSGKGELPRLQSNVPNSLLSSGSGVQLRVQSNVPLLLPAVTVIVLLLDPTVVATVMILVGVSGVHACAPALYEQLNLHHLLPAGTTSA